MLSSQVHFSDNDVLLFFSQLLDTLDRPVLIIDLKGQIIYVNQVVVDHYGWSMDELVNCDVSEFVSTPPIMELIHENLERLPPGESWWGDFQVLKKDGTHTWTAIQVFPLKSDQQTLVSLVCASQNKLESQQLQVANQILTSVDLLLGDVVDYEAMLGELVQFVIPQLTDWCGIHLLQEDGSLERVALAPAQAINEWLQNDLPNDETDGLPAVLHSGESKLITQVNPNRRAARLGIKSYMILPIITHRQVRGAITFVSAESGRQFDQNSLALAENLARNLSIYLEKNRLYKESQRLKLELEQRVSERTAELSNAVAQLKQSEAMIQTLFRISNKLNSTLDVDLILDELAQEAIQIVNGESGFAGLRTAEGMTVHKYFQRGMTAIAFEHTWPLGEGIPGWVLKYKVPYGTSDAVNDPLISRELAINANIRSIICTPILDSVGEVIGYFDIRNKIDAEGFTIGDQEMLLTLAPVASIAIQNALAYQQRLATVAELKESSRQLEELAASLESAREEERLRIARELHDQLGQALTAMKFDLTSLTDQIGNIDIPLAHQAKDLLTQLNAMIKTVRRISTELRPGMLDDLGLVASIEWQSNDFEKRTGIECIVSLPEHEISLTHDQSLALFRILQESLTNVARYAGAKHIDITLTNLGEVLYFEIHDDGRGIREEEINGVKSLGILGMRERVKHIGGTFEIQGIPGEGTFIKVTIPINHS
jgi:PAS domain S-box-containing protein